MEYCTFTEPQQGFTYDEQLAFARATERAGFDGFFRSDHYMRMGAGDPLPGPTDAWTTLAGLARETSRIRLGTLVSSATHRVPAVLAIQVAQVDEMSGGRVELGLGTGWFEAEHRAYGIPFPAKRFGILEEQLEIVTGLWSTPVGETFDFAGRHYTLAERPPCPSPRRRACPSSSAEAVRVGRRSSPRGSRPSSTSASGPNPRSRTPSPACAQPASASTATLRR